MADIKITDLAAYTDPVSNDVLPIVDIGNDLTKKVSIANLVKNAGAGSAASPSFSFDGDNDTGLYQPGANQIAIATNGTQRLLVTSSGSATFAAGIQSNSLVVVDGGTVKSRIRTDGSADFAGDVVAGDNPAASANNEGVILQSRGTVKTNRSSGAIYQGYTTGSSTPTIVFNADGSAEFAGSVSIGGTAAANVIDEYEEGSWTPTMSQFNGSSIPFTLSTANYVRVGEVVTILATLTLTAASNGQELDPVIAGLPYAPKGRSNFQITTTNSTNNTQGYSSSSSFIARGNSSIQAGATDAEQLVITSTYIKN